MVESSSSSGYEASNDSGAVVVIGISNQHSGEGPRQAGSSLQGGNTNLNVTQEHDPVAKSPGPVTVTHVCAEAFAGQGKLAGFTIAQVDYVCQVSRIIQANTTQAARLRANGDRSGAKLIDAEIAQRIKELNEWIKLRWWSVRIFLGLRIVLMIGVTGMAF